jgi:hypothetical protein
MWNKSNLLLLAALIFITISCEQPTDTDKKRVPFEPDDNPILIDQLPRYINIDSIYVTGKLLGYDSIICTGGKKVVSKKMTDSIFYLVVPLNLNSKNTLIFFGKDLLNHKSDTLQATIIHDNIPPVLIASSLEPKLPFSFEFDSQLYSAFINSSNSDFNNLQPIYSLEKRKITFEWPAISFYIGDYFPFEISVYDSASNRLKFSDTITTYISRIKPDGLITKIFLSKNEDRLFVLRYNFQEILIYNTINWSFHNKIELNFAPLDAALNPYNNLLYCVNRYGGKVVVVEPESGQIIKEITLLPAGNQTYPSDDPIHIAFGDNGVGLIPAEPLESPCGKCIPQIIDSPNNDAISVPPGFDQEDYRSLRANTFDNGNYIALTDMCTTAGDILIFDCATREFISAQTPGGYFTRVTPDKNSERFVVGGTQGTYIITSEGIKSETYGPGRYMFLNFTNKSGEENIAYYINTYDFRIGILDLISYEKSPLGFSSSGLGFLVTTDGEQIVNIFEQSVLIFKPSIFR